LAQCLSSHTLSGTMFKESVPCQLPWQRSSRTRLSPQRRRNRYGLRSAALCALSAAAVFTNSPAWVPQVPGRAWFPLLSGVTLRASNHEDEARMLNLLDVEDASAATSSTNDGLTRPHEISTAAAEVPHENSMAAAEGVEAANALVTLMATVGSLRVPDNVTVHEVVQNVSGAVASMISGKYINSLPSSFDDVFNATDAQSWRELLMQHMESVGVELGRPTAMQPESTPVLDKLGLTVSGASAYRESNGWRVPVGAHLFQRNEGRHFMRLALCKRLLFQRLLGISDSDPESTQFYEQRARLIFRNMDMDPAHRRQILEARLKDGGSGSGTAWHRLPATDRQGRVDSSIWFSDEEVMSAAGFGNFASLEVRVVDRPSLPPSRSLVQLLEDRGVSVISDIDDTVKVSEVFLGVKQLLRNIFFKKWRAAEGMPQLYRSWARDHGASFHFVSKSPPEFREPLQEFLNEEQFPAGSIHLCPIISSERSTFKERQIESIMEEFPKRRFVLVGDSGERDAEIYAAIMRRHPARVMKIFIRQVSPQHPVDTSVFEDISPRKWQVITNASEAILRVKAPPTVLNIPGMSIKWPRVTDMKMPQIPAMPTNVKMPALAMNWWPR